MHLRFLAGATLLILCSRDVGAGEIPGLPTLLPPSVASPYAVTFSNDFLGRGGSVDDFRTQQIIFSADMGDRWFGVIDHSVLTLSGPPEPGRIDQLSATLGYRILDRESAGTSFRLSAGVGLRSVGDFYGERMQNGFHRLVGSDVEGLPYSDTSRTRATAFVDADRYSLLYESVNGWRWGTWLAGRALATGGGEFDASASFMAMASRQGFDAWAGLRHDWRSGYDEDVQRATAVEEEDLAFVLGLRFGGLVLETVQQFNNDASFGQLRLLSLEADSGRRKTDVPRLGLEFGFLLPDVYMRLAARFRGGLPYGGIPGWRDAILVSADFGEPQDGGDVDVYIRSTQLAAGFDLQRPLTQSSGWIAAYLGAAVGWRREQLVGDGALLGETSESVDRAVFVINAGLRFDSSSLGTRWRYRIHTGLSAWLPAGTATLSLGTTARRVQEPGVNLMLGVSFDAY